MSDKLPYEERPDLDKLKAQWTKRKTHIKKKDWSAAIIRMATAAEIAANIAIRSEFSSIGNLTIEQINKYLRDANGLHGKMSRLLLPLRYRWNGQDSEYTRLLDIAQTINTHRNAIVHQGQFRNKSVQQEIEAITAAFIEELVGFYHPGYQLPKKRKINVFGLR